MFTFIDLFSGIGGFRIACQHNGGECVFSSEIDKDARKTYEYNFGESPYGDITAQHVKSLIPNEFDVLCGGFPCQPFSIAGNRMGFEDTRGTLFYEIVSIANTHRPKVLFLENVKNLVQHDEGRTFSVIKRSFEEIGYRVFYKVMNATEYADVPQNRERVFIIAINEDVYGDDKEFVFPNKIPLTHTIMDCIDQSITDERFFLTSDNMKRYDVLSLEVVKQNTIYQWRRSYVRENKSNVCPTLTASMGTGGTNVPMILTDYGIRKLTPEECLRFQGFPSWFKFPDEISYSARYKQVGNSVVVPLVERIGESIVRQLL